MLTPEPDFIILTKTWLHPGILDSEFGFQGYTIYRKNRYDYVVGRGVGLLIALKSGLMSSEVDFRNSTVEQMFIKISGSFMNLIVRGTTRRTLCRPKKVTYKLRLHHLDSDLPEIIENVVEQYHAFCKGMAYATATRYSVWSSPRGNGIYAKPRKKIKEGPLQ